MSIQVIDACTYALLARKMQPAPPEQPLSSTHVSMNMTARRLSCRALLHDMCAGHESSRWASRGARASPVKVERIQRHQQTSSKMWSQMRPPLSKQRSETYRMLYLQKVLQQQCRPLTTWRSTLLLRKQCFC